MPSSVLTSRHTQWREISVAVRHRRLLDSPITAAYRVFAGLAQPAAPPPVAAPLASPEGAPDKLVVEVWLAIHHRGGPIELTRAHVCPARFPF